MSINSVFFNVAGVGMHVPDKILTNDEIESWNIGTTAEWIKNNVGVIERRISSNEDKCYDYAIFAAQTALANAELNAKDIDLIITASVTADNIMPHTAAFLKSGLKANNSICFDIQAACAGFIYGTIVAINMANNNSSINNILVVASEMFSRITDWTDRKLCCAYGDGAGAFVIRKSIDSPGIIATSFLHDDEGIKYHEMPAYYGQVPDGTSIYHNYQGRKIVELLYKNFPKVINNLLTQSKWDKSEIDLLVISQVNKLVVEDILKSMKIPVEKAHMIMHKYGYTGASCYPITIFDALQSGKLKRGDKVIIVGSGLGCYYGGISLIW